MARVAMNEEWARIGAAARLQEIDRERLAILRAYPDLAKTSLGRAPSGARNVDALGRRRRTISPDGRKRMSDGMRKYWAKRKAAERK